MDLDVGFIPVDRPGHGGPGSVQTSSLLIQELSQYFDFTVYVISNESVQREKLPATSRVEYVINDNLPIVPHPLHKKRAELSNMEHMLERHDLIHSYCSEYISELSEITVPTMVSLNSYRPICPKEDFQYMGKKKCSGPSHKKCLQCVTETSIGAGQGYKERIKSYYTSLYQIKLSKDTRAAGEGIDAYHSLSPHLKEDYELVGFEGKDITVIPHFYDDNFYVNKKNMSQKTIEQEVKILTVGRLEEKKGVQILLKAIPGIINRGYKPEVRIVGSGSYKDELQQIATELDIEDYVKWYGFVDYSDLPSIYRSSDIFIYPGLWDEPFGRVFLEAMGTRLPILASNVGSVDYIIGDSGYTFERGNSDDLVNKFVELADDYESIRQETIPELERFEKEKIINEFKSTYQTVSED